MGAFLRDVKYGVRSLRRDRGFALTVLLTFAVSIAANAVLFAMVNSVKLVAVGFVLGIVGVAFVQKAVATQIYGIRPYDPLVLAGVMALLAGIALVACAVPARRAMRVDPVVVLRYE